MAHYGLALALLVAQTGTAAVRDAVRDRFQPAPFEAQSIGGVLREADRDQS